MGRVQQAALAEQQGREALIELAAKPAKLVVTGVTQGQHGIRHVGTMGALLALQGLPERRRTVGRIAIAEGAMPLLA